MVPTTTAVVAVTTAAAVVSDDGLVWQPSPTAPATSIEDFIDQEDDEPSRLLFIQQPLRRRHLAPEPTSFPLLKRQVVSFFLLLLKPSLFVYGLSWLSLEAPTAAY